MEAEERKIGPGAAESRKPAPGPPRRWREQLHSLPRYSGPYSVGMMEIEVPVREPRAFSHIKRNHTSALRMDTVMYSLYYPCEVDFQAKPDKKFYRPLWLPTPRVPTCKGYAKFLSVPHMPVTAYIAMTTMFAELPAYRNAPLASHRLVERRESSDCPRRSCISKPIFPVVMFSHGLGGSRTCLSTICGELASNGLVVVAVEHRDGSGARSYVNIPPHGTPADGQLPERTKAGSNYVVDYLFPKDNPLDTAPHNERGVDTELRNAQIEMRMAEIEEAYRSLELINNGQGELISKINLRKKGSMGSSSHGLDGVDWNDWTGRMHMQNVTAMGHSFGGATTVQIMRHNDRFPWIGQGILLDAWGPATPVLEETTLQQATKPLLIICSEAFMHWKENFDRMMSICHEVSDGGSYCWMMTIKGSTHLSWTDFALLYARLMSFLWKTTVNPRRAIYLTIGSALEFLKQVLPKDQTMETCWVDEGILNGVALSPEKSLPHGNRPDDKWIAARLKIPQESRLRVQAWYRRRLGRRSRAPQVPTDYQGKPLWGVMQYHSGHEVWIHVNPTEEDMSRS